MTREDRESGRSFDRINMMAAGLYRALWDDLEANPGRGELLGLHGLPDPDGLLAVYVSDESEFDDTGEVGAVIPILKIGLLLDKQEETA